MNDQNMEQFKKTVRNYYRVHGRHDLPWRRGRLAGGGLDPYRVMVSEVMLQQTQVARVIPKYREFLRQFPTLRALADAELGTALCAWNGLGYNRRAKFLHRAARRITGDYDGKFPQTANELITLPGIGRGTAGAVVAYAFNRPAVFVETNIRTVFIHHFFRGRNDIADGEILELVGLSLDAEQPREWYWALTDYGAYLKKEIGNLNMLSKAYQKQPAFEGSRRQIRGQVIRLLSQKSLNQNHLRQLVNDERLAGILDDLLREGLITRKGALFYV